MRQKIDRQIEQMHTFQRYRLHLINDDDRVRKPVHPPYTTAFPGKECVQKLHHRCGDHGRIPFLGAQLIFMQFFPVLQL